MNVSIGIDIGGTKCALSVGECTADSVKILHREEFPTKGLSWQEVLEEFSSRINQTIKQSNNQTIANVGISCGGPLDSKAGVIMSPPNLLGWDDVPVVKFFADRYQVPVHLQNDANACAYAEWKFGAGRGTKNMVFMTFGTGLGAGIIIDGKLYSGTNDVAWETAFAQQVLGLGCAGDVLIALSTSGNSANCVAAAQVAAAKGMKVVSLTGADGGKLAELADAAIRVPETETFKVQELHLPVYHALCAAVEDACF